MKRTLFLLTLLFLGFQMTYVEAAEESSDSRMSRVRLEASADKTLITIGEKINYTISLIAPLDSEIAFPATIADFGGFALKDFEESKPRKISQELLEYTNTYLLDTYTTGSYIIPKQRITVKWKDGFSKEMETPEIFVTVKSLLEEGELKDIRDIKEPMTIISKSPIIWIIILVVIVLGALIWSAKKFIKIKPKPKKIDPAHIIALRELERIEKMGCIEKGEYKEYHYLLSIALRIYLENRYALRAPEQTTEEFFESLRGNPVLHQREINMLTDFLQSCDLVKYAKLTPKRDDISTIMQKARFFIEETKDVPGDGKKELIRA